MLAELSVVKVQVVLVTITTRTLIPKINKPFYIIISLSTGQS